MFSSRKIGKGYALALKTGGGTHCTLVYFRTCRRGYEQEMVEKMAEDYFDSLGIDQVDLILGGSYASRSVLVGGRLEEIRQGLVQLFAEKFELYRIRPLHIDLRGQSDQVIKVKGVSLKGNWNR